MKFEKAGILCRDVNAVFTVPNSHSIFADEMSAAGTRMPRMFRRLGIAMAGDRIANGAVRSLHGIHSSCF